MKTLILIALLLLASPLRCHAQEYAYGEPSDLKGLKKVYVNTGPDIQSRNAIIKDLEKSKLGFEVVDDIDAAEIRLVFGAGTVADRIVGTVRGDRVVLRERSSRTGVGVVVVHARGKDRVVHSFNSTQESGNSPFAILRRKPVSNFTREFIKVYKKGNALK